MRKLLSRISRLAGVPDDLAGTDVGGVLESYSWRQLLVRAAEEYLWWLIRSLPGLTGAFLRYRFLKLTTARLDGFCWIGPGCAIENSFGLSIGKGFNANRNVYIDGRGGVEIGDYTGVGANSVIMSVEHTMVSSNPMGREGIRLQRVKIGSHVWIGSNCFIKAGVSLGDRAVVAACSSVLLDVPERAWVIGSPARSYPRAMRELLAGEKGGATRTKPEESKPEERNPEEGR